MKRSETEKIFEGSAYTQTSHFGHFLINSWGGGGSAFTRDGLNAIT
jgi:hypothetical protein